MHFGTWNILYKLCNSYILTLIHSFPDPHELHDLYKIFHVPKYTSEVIWQNPGVQRVRCMDDIFRRAFTELFVEIHTIYFDKTTNESGHIYSPTARQSIGLYSVQAPVCMQFAETREHKLQA